MSHRIQHLFEHLSPQSQQHLHDVQMTYREHLVFSGELSAKLLYGAYTAFMHALLPSLYTSNTTKLVKQLQSTLNHAQQRTAQRHHEHRQEITQPQSQQQSQQQHTESQLQEANQ